MHCDICGSIIISGGFSVATTIYCDSCYVAHRKQLPKCCHHAHLYHAHDRERVLEYVRNKFILYAGDGYHIDIDWLTYNILRQRGYQRLTNPGDHVQVLDCSE